jgi:hypothetical protein
MEKPKSAMHGLSNTRLASEGKWMDLCFSLAN